MTSYHLHKCLIIDARDHILGRLASTVAKHALMGTRVIILRCERIVMSGHLVRNKLKMMAFRGHRMNTNPRKGPFSITAPSRMFFRVVRGMLPHKKPRGKAAMSRISVYDGIPPRFAHVKKMKVIPAFRCIKLDPNRPYTSLGRLMANFGWTHGKLMCKLEDKRRIKQAQVWRIQKEIHQFRKRAVKIVAKRYCTGKQKADYEWMTQFDYQLPTVEEVMAPQRNKDEPKEKSRFHKLHPTKKAEWVHVPNYDEQTGEYTKQTER